MLHTRTWARGRSGSDLSVSSGRRRGCSRRGGRWRSTPLRRLLQLAKHLAFMTIGKAAAGGALCGSFGVFGLVLLPANITSLVFLQVGLCGNGRCGLTSPFAIGLVACRACCRSHNSFAQHGPPAVCDCHA